MRLRQILLIVRDTVLYITGLLQPGSGSGPDLAYLGTPLQAAATEFFYSLKPGVVLKTGRIYEDGWQ
jgi:hypothetical protein